MSAEFSDLLGLAARDVVKAVRNGAIAPDAYVRACLSRIDEFDAQVRAWAFVDPKRVLAAAKTTRPGPLQGLPIGVKDVFDTVECPTAYGSRAYLDHRPVADAASVALVRQAGALVLGKTATTEFAAVAPTLTRNPHNLEHTPGGSSSGSAAAVACGMTPIAFGTQTAGSIIRPASYCGVVGFKPAFQAFPRAGLKPLADSLDTVGLLARDVRDAAWFGAVLSGRPDWEVERPIAPRIGFCRTSLWDRASETVRGACEAVAAAAAAVGAAVDECDGPSDYEGLIDAHLAIMGWETPRALAYELVWRSSDLAAKTIAFAQPSPAVSPETYDQAVTSAMRARADVADWFGDCDVILTLAALDTAPRSLDSTGDPVCNRVWTLLGVPCLALPAYLAADGLPIGVQLVGRPGREGLLLAAAAFIEDVLAYPRNGLLR